MLDDEPRDQTDSGSTSRTTQQSADAPAAPEPTPRKRTRAKKTAAPEPAAAPAGAGANEGGSESAASPAKTRRPRKVAAPKSPPNLETADASPVSNAGGDAGEAAAGVAPTPARKRARKRATAAPDDAGLARLPVAGETSDGFTGQSDQTGSRAESAEEGGATTGRPGPAVPTVVFRAPEQAVEPSREASPRRRTRSTGAAKAAAGDPTAAAAQASPAEAHAPLDSPAGTAVTAGTAGTADGDESEERPAARRRRGRRGGRGRSGGSAGVEAGDGGDDAEALSVGVQAGAAEPAHPTRRGTAAGKTAAQTAAQTAEAVDGAADETLGADEDETVDEGTGAAGDGARRRRRRRRRRSDAGAEGGIVDEDGVETVVHVREGRAKQAADDDEAVRGVKGSTRLEAKRQRRREGRDTGRRRAPIISEAEFLARRESVERVMVVRQSGERTQIGVLEDGVLVEHYVARKDHTSMVGNVYLGKVQNVLPSMEAAFVDIGRGRNAVLYAGEVNYDASALEGRPPRIEQALKSGQSVLVQVTKDPIGHKGGRLTSQVSLPGRYMVYVPDGRLSGISRKLPDTERSRLKGILKRLTPEDAGVIIRTAAEGASEEELERDLNRLHAQWQDIEKKAQTASAPSLIYGEPDVVIRVIRDIFNEDFKELVVSGDDEWDTIDNYVRWVAPDLAERTRRWNSDEDVFAAYRIDEQLAKALDRKVWLPSGGYLVIDRTEAMIVVDVNTGRFTGKGGGNLEETVTKNNLEAAEEIVRQLRLRDLGGIIVIDFIDMVLESNRDLVLRRLMECLGRDRTRHQVAEVTSLGLVQMTRKRVGQGLLEVFSEPCKECGGRGVKLTLDPVAEKRPKPKPKPLPPPPRLVPATVDAQPNGQPADTEPSDTRPADTEPADTEPADTEPIEVEAIDAESTDGVKPRARRSRGGRGRGSGTGTKAVAPVASSQP